MLEKWGKGGTVIVAATALFVVSLFMPWVEFILSVNGFQQQGYFVLILFAYPLYTALASKPINAIGGYLSSLAALVGMVLFLNSKSGDIFGESFNAAASGMYVAIVSCVVLIIGVFLKTKEN
ncbi:hypothetical protein ACLIA0_05100 [Bacillaceae bacterium W0354]